MKKPAEVFALMLLISLLSLNALAGGFMMMLAPSGQLLGLTKSWLETSPFSDFFVPGLILFLFLGGFPLFALAGLLSKPKITWPGLLNPYPDKHWGWTYSLFSGIIAISWISIQQMMTDYFYLQPAIAIAGLLIIIFTMLPRIIKYYSL